MKLKTRKLVVLPLLLSACGGGGGNSVDPIANENAPGLQTPGSVSDVPGTSEEPVVNSPAGSNTMGLACRSPIDPIDQVHDVVLFDALDYEAFDHLLDSSMETLNLAEQAAANIAYSSLSLAKLETLGLSAVALYCDYEQYADNQCQSTLVSITSADITAGVLSYTYTEEDGFINTTVMISDPQYSSGSYRRTDSEGKVTDYTWSRDSVGTERFTMSANDGSLSDFMELSDCSGSASRVYVSSTGQPGITTNTSWTSPVGSGFTVSFETCNLNDGSPGCTSFTL